MTTHHRVALLHLKCLATTTAGEVSRYRSLGAMEGTLITVAHNLNADCRTIAWRSYEIMEATLMRRIANNRIDPLDMRTTSGGNNAVPNSY